MSNKIIKKAAACGLSAVMAFGLVDLYSGFVYSMLDIPLELFTPIFAMARIVGWSAHRLEELTNVDKIIRPAYQSVQDEKEYIEMEDR